MRRSQRVWSAALAIALGAGVVTIQQVQAQQVTRTNKIPLKIAQQPIGDALNEFARQSGLHIVLYSDVVQGVMSPRLEGEYTPDDALEMLLAHTGLHYEYLDTRTVAVLGQKAGAHRTSATGADVVQDPVVKPDSMPASESRLASAGAIPSADEPDTSGSEGNPKSTRLAEVVITGTSIRGVYPDSSPLIVYTADDIKATGATTSEEFFDRLPQNFNSLRADAASGLGTQANQDSINGIDLRGLGVGTTLVLLNGHPLAPASSGKTPDISLIPLADIKRVEVLTDGASAIYGADAVGGVVNFVTRDDFDGAETDASYGVASGGGYDNVHAQQTFGTNWGSGNALVSAGYYDQSALMAADRDFSRAAGLYTLIPQDTRKNVYLSGKQDIDSAVRLFGDVLYSDRSGGFHTVQTVLGTESPVDDRFHNDGSDLFSNVGADFALTRQLNLELAGTFTRGTEDQLGSALPNSGTSPFGSISQSRDVDINAKLDGEIMTLPGGTARFALGGGHTSELYRYSSYAGAVAADSLHGNLTRRTNYAFTELFIPVFGPQQNIPGLQRLELTLAGRDTDYSDFGNNTSPKVGLVWAPVEGIKLRGTFARSFRAPFLTQIDPSKTSWAILPVGTYPAIEKAYDLPKTDYLLFAEGNGSDLGPETAKTKTAGIDFTPEPVRGLKLSATWFDIDYANRIAAPDPSFAGLKDPALYPSSFTLDPSAAQLAQIVLGTRNFLNSAKVNPSDPAAVAAATAILYDDRTVNLLATQLSGLDFDLSYSHAGLVAGVQAAKTFHYRTQVALNQPVSEILSTVGNPVAFRARSWVGYGTGTWNTQLNVNYTNRYSDPFDPTQPEVASWTTLDLSGMYTFDSNQGWLSGLRLSLSVQNLLDRDPPYVGVSTNANSGVIERIGYDPANASPIGRFITFGFTKRFGVDRNYVR